MITNNYCRVVSNTKFLKFISLFFKLKIDKIANRLMDINFKNMREFYLLNNKTNKLKANMLNRFVSD